MKKAKKLKIIASLCFIITLICFTGVFLLTNMSNLEFVKNISEQIYTSIRGANHTLDNRVIGILKAWLVNITFVMFCLTMILSFKCFKRMTLVFSGVKNNLVGTETIFTSTKKDLKKMKKAIRAKNKEEKKMLKKLNLKAKLEAKKLAKKAAKEAKKVEAKADAVQEQAEVIEQKVEQKKEVVSSKEKKIQDILDSLR